LRELLTGPARTPASGVLARRLTDAGLAHPRPAGAGAGRVDVTVLIPVRDPPHELARCPAGLGGPYPLRVGAGCSAAPAATADVAAQHGATLIRRPVGGGPGPARDTGLAAIGTDVIALLDSDCVPPPDWIARLSAHLADPLVGAVAPRIVAVTAPGAGP